MKKYAYKLKLNGLSTPQGTICVKLPGQNKIAIHGYKPGWLKDIWGKWPGDESVDELLAVLKNK